MVNPMNKDDVLNTRDKILQAALPGVVFDGWNWDGVLAGAGAAGIEAGTVRAVFPGGLIDVLDGFADRADRQVLAALADTNPDDMRVRDRVRTAVLARFGVLTPHKEPLRRSLTYWAVPTRKPRAAKIVWRSADRIWNWAGDTATDYNHYTKRALLSGVIVSTTLAWLGDDTGSMNETEAFLDRRIENIMNLGRWVGKIKGKMERSAA